MSELPAKIRGMYHVSKTDLQYIRIEALKLCDEHERAEAKIEELRNSLIDTVALFMNLLEAYIEENGEPTNDYHPAHQARAFLGMDKS